MHRSPNPAALLLQHLYHQSNKRKGDTRIGGLVTHLVKYFGIQIPVMQHVDVSILMDVKHITSCGFLGVYRADKRLRGYQSGYLDASQDEQVSLPCPQAF